MPTNFTIERRQSLRNRVEIECGAALQRLTDEYNRNQGSVEDFKAAIEQILSAHKSKSTVNKCDFHTFYPTFTGGGVSNSGGIYRDRDRNQSDATSLFFISIRQY